MNPLFISRFMALTIFFCFTQKVCFSQVDEVSSDKFLMNINGYSLKIPFYTNHNIYAANSEINKAIIVLHGNTREAMNQFDNMELVVSNAAAVEGTLLVAPQFLTEEDIDFHSLDNEHLYWTSGGWKSGSNSRDEDNNPRPARIPSYAVIDSLFLHLAEQFPNLDYLVFAGHSAGGQFTQRHAATSSMADMLCENFNISSSYIVANPSSYVYMNGQRVVAGTNNVFSTPSTSCDDYNEWKYGLEDLYTYPDLTGADSIRNRYKRRIVTYLLGEADNNPNSTSLDVTCRALLQGAHRYERGEVFYNYLQHYYGNTITETHEFRSVPNIGHDSYQMYNSSQGNYALFEKPFIVSCGSVVGIAEFEEAVSVSIYPNPARQTINISANGSSNANIHLCVFDLHGRLVFNRETANEDVIEISSLNNGLYFFQLQLDGRIFSKTIVIE